MATKAIKDHVSYINKFEVEERQLVDLLADSKPDWEAAAGGDRVSWDADDEGTMRVTAEQTHFATDSIAARGEQVLLITIKRKTSTTEDTYKFITRGEIGWREEFGCSGLIRLPKHA